MISRLITFLHACFVWYAETQFWASAIGARHFSPDRARSRLIRAVRGFLGPPLVRQLDPYRQEIHPRLYQSVLRMQATIREAFPETETDPLPPRVIAP